MVFGFVYILEWPNSRLIDSILTKNNIFPFSNLFAGIFSVALSQILFSMSDNPIFSWNWF